jgi:hypothetical protein
MDRRKREGKGLGPAICMITEQEFAAKGLALSRQAKVLDTLHKYFVSHCHRLYGTCTRFGLLEKDLGEVLDIGPFYGYTPFLLRSNSASYTVLEGDDPAAYPLKPLYEEHHIAVRFVDLCDSFGPATTANHRLPFERRVLPDVALLGDDGTLQLQPSEIREGTKAGAQAGGLRLCYCTQPGLLAKPGRAGVRAVRAEEHQFVLHLRGLCV